MMSATNQFTPNKPAALARLLEVLPAGAVPAFLAAAEDPSQAGNLESVLSGFDWNAHRDAIEDVLRAFLPLDELVPETYAKWRPVVADGFAFLGARLSPDRLVPKLAEQLALPETAVVEDRVLLFIKRIPSLQKIGQIIARNSELDAALRSRLEILEDGIHEVEEPEIRAEIEGQLGAGLSEQEVDLQPGLYAEGSVSALMRFTCRSAGRAERLSGVFKVLKPFIPRYFQEDLKLLADLAEYFEANQRRYDLEDLSLRSILDNVRELFVLETNFPNERANLIAARLRYAGVPGIRIPMPILRLCTETITAMTEERSVKIVDAALDDPQLRASLARNLAECLVARPLFSPERSSPFHADPHSGNLRVHEETGEIVLLDWALTGDLTEEDRRNLIRLFVMLSLRDEAQLLDALWGLSTAKTDAGRRLMQREIEIYIDSLPLGSLPGSGSLGALVGRLLRAGAQFSGQFLVFRKMLTTLQDVISQLAPGETIERIVSRFALTHGLQTVCGRGSSLDAFRLPLQLPDYLSIGFSAQTLLPRAWLQTLRTIARSAVRAVPATSASEPK